MQASTCTSLMPASAANSGAPVCASELPGASTGWMKGMRQGTFAGAAAASASAALASCAGGLHGDACEARRGAGTGTGVGVGAGALASTAGAAARAAVGLWHFTGEVLALLGTNSCIDLR